MSSRTTMKRKPRRVSAGEGLSRIGFFVEGRCSCRMIFLSLFLPFACLPAMPRAASVSRGCLGSLFAISPSLSLSSFSRENIYTGRCDAAAVTRFARTVENRPCVCNAFKMRRASRTMATFSWGIGKVFRKVDIPLFEG